MSVDYAKIGLYQAGLGNGIEEMAEILHRGTNLQGTVDNPPVGCPPFFPIFHFHQIVGLGVHQGKTNGVCTHPCLFQGRKVSTIHIGNEVILLPFYISNMISQIVRITVFP